MESLPGLTDPPGRNTAPEPSRVLGPEQMLETYELSRTFFSLTSTPTPIKKRALKSIHSVHLHCHHPSLNCHHLLSGHPEQSPNWAAPLICSPHGSQEEFEKNANLVMLLPSLEFFKAEIHN